MQKLRVVRTVAALAVLATAGGGRAETDPGCKLSALEEKRACVAACREDFRTAVFRCKNVDPVCGNACLAGRERCLEPYNAILDGCLDGCRAELRADKTRCQDDCNGNQACLDACVDAAQVEAFVCRDNCREAFRNNEEAQNGIQNCRAAFRACVNACPPAP